VPPSLHQLFSFVFYEIPPSLRHVAVILRRRLTARVGGQSHPGPLNAALVNEVPPFFTQLSHFPLSPQRRVPPLLVSRFGNSEGSRAKPAWYLASSNYSTYGVFVGLFRSFIPHYPPLRPPLLCLSTCPQPLCVTALAHSKIREVRKKKPLATTETPPFFSPFPKSP